MTPSVPEQGPGSGAGSSEPSVGELLRQLTVETGALVRKEVTLAAVETTEKIAAAGFNALLVAIGSLTAVASVVILGVGAVVALAEVMDAWVASLLVGGALGVIALGFIIKGVRAWRRITLVPVATLKTLEENKSWAQELVR